MKISIIGTGYVGSVTGAGLSSLNHNVIFCDIDEKKVNLIKEGDSPIFEPGLKELILANLNKITVTTSIYNAVKNSEITFVCVGTPPKEDFSIDLVPITNAISGIAEAIRDLKRPHYIIIKSTVLPGTASHIFLPILTDISGKIENKDFFLGSNPEFLREGMAIHDFFHPDRIIIGAENEDVINVLKKIYSPISSPILCYDRATAEMIKYTSNAFLAAKISFSNEIGNLCKKIGIDSYQVFEGVGMDKRIGNAFFRSGIGFGGSCFPKDIKALIHFARSNCIKTPLMDATMNINENQPHKMIDFLKKYIPVLYGKQIGILGLSFKPDTDDIRESRAITIVDELLRENAQIIAYDPQAMTIFKELYPQIQYASSMEQLKSTDAILILTEWKEFNNFDYQGKVVIDGRRILKAKNEASFYEGICW